MARLARERYHANVLCLGADDLGASDARACVQEWISASFRGARYEESVSRLQNLGAGKGGDPVGPDLAKTTRGWLKRFVWSTDANLKTLS